MGDLERDLHLQGEQGRYRGRVSPDWVVFTPCGGFLASLALRAAGLQTPEHFPAALSCHFLNVPRIDAVDLDVGVLREGRRARSMRVSMTQEGTRILEALIWTTAPSSDPGFDHETPTMPRVPGPDEVPQWNPRAGDHIPDEVVPFWRNLDARMVGWPEGQRWEQRTRSDPVRTEWSRFRPRATFDDPYVDAARSLLLIDTLMLPAAMMFYPEPLTHFAPSLDLTAWFHAAAVDEEWLLCEAVSPLARNGVVAGTARIWTRDGRLIASGGQQMLSRRVAPDPVPSIAGSITA